MRPAPRIHPDLFCAPPDYRGPEGGVAVQWPPTVEDALAAVRGRKIKDYPARFIVLACAVAAAARDDDDLLRAYRILVDVSNLKTKRRLAIRALAAVNMAPILVAMGHEGAMIVAGMELQNAYAFASDVEGLEAVMESAAQMVEASLRELRARGMLRWTGSDRLEPCDSVAGARLRLLPDHPLEGAWEGVHGILRCWGLEVEGPSRLPDPVRARAESASVSVTEWTRAA